MKILKIERDSVELRITLDELMILNNAFQEVVSELEEEFKIRTEFKIPEMELIFNSIKQAIETEEKEAILQFSSRDIIGIYQVLNELCNGIKVDNFEQKIGVDEQDARKTFERFDVLKELVPKKHPIVHKEYRKELHNYTDFVVTKFYCLKSLEYDFYFYMRRIDFADEKLEFAIVLQQSGSDKVIARTEENKIPLQQLQDIITLLQAQVNVFDYEKNTFIRSSFLNETVTLNVNNVESHSSDSTDEPTVSIDFIFLTKKSNSYLKEQTSFTSTTTLDNISEFATSVEDFLNEVRSHIYSKITYIF